MILSIAIGVVLGLLIVAFLPAVLAWLIGVVVVALAGVTLAWLLGWDRLVALLVLVSAVGLLTHFIMLLVRFLRWISSARGTKNREGSSAAKSPILQAALERERFEDASKALRGEGPDGEP